MMRKKENKSHLDRLQMLALLLFLLILIGLSALTTLVLTGNVDLNFIIDKPIDYIVDAEKVCVRRVKADYGDEVSGLVVDDRSSYYDKSNGQYKLHYELDIFRDGSKRSGTRSFYVNCVVTADDGDIHQIVYLEKESFKPKAVRRETGNEFGF
jgi:hypothetical protein